MILLVSNELAVQGCAPVLEKDLQARVEVAPTIRQAVRKLRDHDYEVIIFDELTLQEEPSKLDGVLRHAGAAVPLFVNPAITATERLVSESRAALRRATAAHAAAIDAARRQLRNELRDEVTGLVLSSQLALAALPAESSAKVKALCEWAQRLSKKLN